jgi:outer membrane protein
MRCSTATVKLTLPSFSAALGRAALRRATEWRLCLRGAQVQERLVAPGQARHMLDGNNPMTLKSFSLVAIAAAAALAAPAAAQDLVQAQAGTIKLDVRLTGVLPDVEAPVFTAAGVDTGLDVEVDDSVLPSIGLQYYLSPNVSFEVIAGTFDHAASIAQNGTEILDLWHLPPTVTARYHFPVSERLVPYVGGGLTYIWFWDEEGKNGFDVDLDDGFGYTLQAGFDYALSGPWSLNVDVKKVFFETGANVNNGALRSTIQLDPLVVSAGVGYKF